MREYLKDGQIIELKNGKGHIRTFEITSNIGQGATCLVYDGRYIDSLGIYRNVRIKELFPVESCNFKRDANNIVWEKDKEKKEEEFETLYKRHIAFQNMFALSNSVSQINDELLEGNNTKYMILDCASGVTFEKFQPNSLEEIVEVVLALAKTVEKYHEKGYLMLDLKPENFLTIIETNQLVKYLDFDSIIAKDLCQNDVFSKISYSENWAAPELLKGRKGKISFGTDIYAIGAILYNKIFSQYVTAKERSLNFIPDYSTSPYLTKINPKVLHKLTEVFQKTLANNIQNRYENCSSLIEILEDIKKLSDPDELRIISTEIEQKNIFVGRDEELKKIDEAFENGKRLVVINGCGGIGKTELVKEYANINKDKYDVIVFGRYENYMKSFISKDANFNILNCDWNKISYEEQINLLKQLVDENTLIIIDNMDNFTGKDLEIIDSLNCKFIITTRMNIEEFISNTRTSQIIKLDVMYMQDLKNLFKQYYTLKSSVEEDKCIDEIIKYSGGVSIMIPLIAKQMNKEEILPSQMKKNLETAKLKGASNVLVKHYKDNNLVYQSAYNQAVSLFDVFNLSKDEQRILYTIALCGNVKIGRRLLSAFASENNFLDTTEIIDIAHYIKVIQKKANITVVNELIEKGFLEYDSKRDKVFCHNIIREIALYEFGMNIDDIGELKTIIEILCSKFHNDALEEAMGCIDDYYMPLEDTFYLSKISPMEKSQFIELVGNIFYNMDITNKKNRNFIFKRFVSFIFAGNVDFYKIEKLYKKQLSFVSITREENLTFLCINLIVAFLKVKNESFSFYDSTDRRLLIRENSRALEEALTEFLDLYKTMDLGEKAKYYYLSFGVIAYHLINYSMVRVNISTGKKLDEFCKIYLELSNLLEDDEDCISFYYSPEMKKIALNSGKYWEDIKVAEGIYDSESENEAETEEISKSFFAKTYEEFDELIKPTIVDNSMPIMGVYQNDVNIWLKLLSKRIDANTAIKMVEKTDGEIESRCYNRFAGEFSKYYGIGELFCESVIYEYFARQNNYMFLASQIEFINKCKNEKRWDIHSLGGLNGFKMLNAGMYLLATCWNPIFMLKYLYIIWEQCFSPEEIAAEEERKKNTFDIFEEYNSIEDFVYMSKELAHKYCDKELDGKISDGVTNLLGIKLDIQIDEILEGKDIETNKTWDKIEEAFNKINTYKDEKELEELRKSLMKETDIPDQYRKLLLSSVEPTITFFDAAMLSETVQKSQHITCDVKRLEYMLSLEEKNELLGIDEANNLLEICFQYMLIKNKEMVTKYIDKIIHYVENHGEYHNQLDYLLFNLIQIFLRGCTSIELFDEDCLRLETYMIDVWARKYMDKMDYTTMEMIKSMVFWQVKEILSIKDEKELPVDFVNGVNNFIEKVNYIDASFIGVAHMDEYSDRIYKVYTDERKEEYEKRANELKDRWRGENHTKEEYQEKYREILDDVFPMSDEEI